VQPPELLGLGLQVLARCSLTAHFPQPGRCLRCSSSPPQAAPLCGHPQPLLL
jgi:hypothetical protein